MSQQSSLNTADVSALINAMKFVFPTTDEVRDIVKEETKHLPSLEHFDQRMDKLSGEYKKIDEAETLLADTMSEHTDTLENHDQRITALENRKVSSPTPISYPNL